MSSWEYDYLATLERLAEQAGQGSSPRSDRTGVGTFSLFAPPPLDIDLRAGFPVVTTKRVPARHAIAEMLWIMRGGHNVKELHQEGVTIWDEWAGANGDLGRVYGAQWRGWRGGTAAFAVDQLADLVQDLVENPTSRRMVVTAWNPGELWDMALPPCPMTFQAYVEDDQHLSLHVYQRSADWFLGVPFDVVGYAFLAHALSWLTHLEPRRLVFSYGDAHLYSTHLEQARTQVKREPLPPPTVPSPGPVLPDEGLDGWLARVTSRDFKLAGYQHHPALPAPVAV